MTGNYVGYLVKTSRDYEIQDAYALSTAIPSVIPSNSLVYVLSHDGKTFRFEDCITHKYTTWSYGDNCENISIYDPAP